MTKEEHINKLASRFEDKNQQVAYCFGYMDAEKEIIAKAIEWLRNDLYDKEMDTPYCGHVKELASGSYWETDEFIDAFKKAMEE